MELPSCSTPEAERRSHLFINSYDQNVSRSNPISHMTDDWTPFTHNRGGNATSEMTDRYLATWSNRHSRRILVLKSRSCDQDSRMLSLFVSRPGIRVCAAGSSIIDIHVHVDLAVKLRCPPTIKKAQKNCYRCEQSLRPKSSPSATAAAELNFWWLGNMCGSLHRVPTEDQRELLTFSTQVVVVQSSKQYITYVSTSDSCTHSRTGYSLRSSLSRDLILELFAHR